jgi:hypothetical protein
MQVHSSMNSVLPASNKPQSSARCETPGRNILRLSPQNLSRIVECALRLSKNEPDQSHLKSVKARFTSSKASAITLHQSFFDVQLM